ncbi:MAG: hypothetical protein IJJ47_13065 [Methanosphaera sp.]|nr:hypothetical protein [Methanosphaera sp.]
MNKKVIAIIIIVLVILVGAYQFVFVPYQNDQAIKHYNEGLQKASNIDKEINQSLAKISNVSSSNITEGLESTAQALKDSEAKYDEKIGILNSTRNYANGNATKEQYIDYEIQIAQIEKDMTSDLIQKYTEMGDAYEKVDLGRMTEISEQMKNSMNSKANEVKTVQDNLLKLLADNPDLNQTVQGLNLTEDYTGTINVTTIA